MQFSEFDYWHKKANKEAVDGLSSADKIQWIDLQTKLNLALNYYNKISLLETVYYQKDENDE